MNKPKPMPTYWSLVEKVTHLHGQLDQLVVENDKLRELVREMWYVAIQNMDYAERYSFAGVFVDKMREFEIEV